MPSTTRFLTQFLRPATGSVVAEETSYRRGGEELPATLYRPATVRSPVTGWVTLHGLTYHGREHVSLKRLARALAAAGNVILVPDLPEWRELRITPGATVETIKSAVLDLDGRGITRAGRIGVIGFSFGATQALVAASDPALRGHLAGIAAWGGYADIRAAVRFAFLGEHELDGRAYKRDPDPYGRWILAGNYLRLLDEHGGDSPLPDALLGLALEAGRRSVMAWDPALDPSILRIRGSLPPGDRDVFDLLARPSGEVLDDDQRERLRVLGDRMMAAAMAREPELDPLPYLPGVGVPVFLAHGRDDRLIPWTELVRLRRALPTERVSASGITALFAHSTGEKRRWGPGTALEAIRFVRLMRAMLQLI